MKKLQPLRLIVLCVVGGAFVFAPGGWTQTGAENNKSLAEIARESKRKKEQWAGKIWTNDDLGTAFPQINRVGWAGAPAPLGAFQATPYHIVDAMLGLAKVKPGEMVFDLGSGDGRIVIRAAERFGARGVGIEIDESLVEESRKAVAARGLEDQVRILHDDVLNVDLSEADVVTLYVSAQSMETLRPHLERHLRPGARVVSHAAQMPGWEPDRAVDLEGFLLYLYTIR